MVRLTFMKSLKVYFTVLTQNWLVLILTFPANPILNFLNSSFKKTFQRSLYVDVNELTYVNRICVIIVTPLS